MEEVTWEREETIRTNYPFLFEDESMFFLSFDIKMTVADACDCMCLCV